MWEKYSEKYEASTDGHIRNAKTKRVLREFPGKDQYLRTQFDGKTRLVHRAIVRLFLVRIGGLRSIEGMMLVCNRFAILPHMCPECKRYIWLEGYRRAECISHET